MIIFAHAKPTHLSHVQILPCPSALNNLRTFVLLPLSTTLKLYSAYFEEYCVIP